MIYFKTIKVDDGESCNDDFWGHGYTPTSEYICIIFSIFVILTIIFTRTKPKKLLGLCEDYCQDDDDDENYGEDGDEDNDFAVWCKCLCKKLIDYGRCANSEDNVKIRRGHTNTTIYCVSTWIQ